MTFPAVQATNTSEEASNVTSHTVDLPASISSGDLLIILFTVDAAPTITWPSGYTEFADDQRGSTVRGAVAYRQADGTEGATITVTTGSSQFSTHNTYRITGHEDPATQAPEAASADGGSNAPNPPSLTPTGGAEDFLWLAACGHDLGGQSITAFPTNYSNGISINQTNESNGCGAGSAERDLNASSEDPGTFSLSGSMAWVAFTVAIHPASVVAVSPTSHLLGPLYGPLGGPIAV